MGKTAIILGATGLTGNALLFELLDDDNYNRLVLFSRTTCGIKHAKITEYVINLFELENFKSVFQADVVFCCIGTTKAKTPDKVVYHKIDYGIPVTAAKLCVKNKINTFIVVSALGADARSNIFYNKTKGEMEAVVLDLGIKRTYLLQPSLIVGTRKELRLGERLMKGIMSLVSPLFIGKLAQYKPISYIVIVKAMIWLATYDYPFKRIPSNKIKEITQLND